MHQPPPVHQTFETPAFVICSFCLGCMIIILRPYRTYNHNNIDSDEVLYYVDGDFMSRNDIEMGQITLHPAGIAWATPGLMKEVLEKNQQKN